VLCRMTEREVVKSDYVLDPDTGLLLKRAATAINRHGAHHQAFNLKCSLNKKYLRKCYLILTKLFLILCPRFEDSEQYSKSTKMVLCTTSRPP
jgi:hypothetical protein